MSNVPLDDFGVGINFLNHFQVRMYYLKLITVVVIDV